MYEPPIPVDDNELNITAELTEMRTLVERGENEQALVLFGRDIAGLPSDELDGLRAMSIWQEMVDAAHMLPRELQAISKYGFEAARFVDVTTPTLLLTGSESPSLYRDATEAVHEALPNSQIVIFEGDNTWRCTPPQIGSSTRSAHSPENQTNRSPIILPLSVGLSEMDDYKAVSAERTF